MDWKIDLPEAESEEGLSKCSFCNSSQVPVDKAFTGTDVAICHECVRLLAAQVDATSGASPAAEPGAPLENARTCSFCGNEQEFDGAIFAANEKNLYVCFDCVSRFSDSLGPAVS